MYEGEEFFQALIKVISQVKGEQNEWNICALRNKKSDRDKSNTEIKSDRLFNLRENLRGQRALFK